MTTTNLKIEALKGPWDTQTQAAMSDASIDEYAEAMVNGAKFPPIIVYHDSAQYHIADGFHRVMASIKMGALTINAEVRKGTRQDAIRAGLASNADHGIRRTSADKRKSVEIALQEFPELNNVQIARLCNVSDELVRQMTARSNIGTSLEVGKRNSTAKDSLGRNQPRRKSKPASTTHTETTKDTTTVPQQERESSEISSEPAPSLPMSIPAEINAWLKTTRNIALLQISDHPQLARYIAEELTKIATDLVTP